MSEFVDLDGWRFRFNTWRAIPGAWAPGMHCTFADPVRMRVFEVAEIRDPNRGQFQIIDIDTLAVYGMVWRDGYRWTAHGADGERVCDEWFSDRERAVKAILERL